jgi:hypothetical protein
VARPGADLERERRRERERNRILEMLVSNVPLESVLDWVLRGIRSQCPEALCAILLKSSDHCQVLAALDVPGEWLTALRSPARYRSKLGERHSPTCIRPSESRYFRMTVRRRRCCSGQPMRRCTVQRIWA